jgi:hypothetical protein
MKHASRWAAAGGAAIVALVACQAIAAGPQRAGGMPPRGFHEAPPSFHGALPNRGLARPSGRFAAGRSGHDLGRFQGRDYGHFSADQRALWQGGGWRHDTHNGYLGWWWVVGDDWFYYPAPIYPYPLYVGPDYYYDYYSYYPAPAYYWYHCEDPQGYYPTVPECNGPWEPVPPGD